MTARRRLSEHITDALSACAQRLLDQHPDDEALRETLARWMETAHERIQVEAHVERTKSGRIDTRTLRLDVYLHTAEGPAPLCQVRARDLVLADGTPVDARADARLLLLQNGVGIPDDLSGLDAAS